MESVFYNTVSIVFGVFLIIFGIMTLINKKKILFSILTFIHSILFIGAGITGFMIKKELSYITILIMLFLCITMAITVFILYKKEDNTK